MSDEIKMQSKVLKKKLKDANKFRNELGKKTGVTASSADLIREDREHTH